jgi:hypothetical protein
MMAFFEMLLRQFAVVDVGTSADPFTKKPMEDQLVGGV